VTSGAKALTDLGALHKPGAGVASHTRTATATDHAVRSTIPAVVIEVGSLGASGGLCSDDRCVTRSEE
jgi:hypothetical protein